MTWIACIDSLEQLMMAVAFSFSQHPRGGLGTGSVVSFQFLAGHGSPSAPVQVLDVSRKLVSSKIPAAFHIDRAFKAGYWARMALVFRAHRTF